VFLVQIFSRSGVRSAEGARTPDEKKGGL